MHGVCYLDNDAVIHMKIERALDVFNAMLFPGGFRECCLYAVNILCGDYAEQN